MNRSISRHELSRERLGQLFGGGELKLATKGGNVELFAERLSPAELLELAAGRGLVASGELMFERGEYPTGRGSFKKTGATFASCDCGAKLWRVFQLDGDSHFHIECASCKTAQCPSGVCHQ